MKLRAICVGLLVVVCAEEARAQQIPARVMLLVDTSGSMRFEFASNNDTGGDGDANSTYRDLVTGPVNWYPGKEPGLSRLYAAKNAITSVVNGSGSIDFGLMRYALDTSCNDTVRNCCRFSDHACIKRQYSDGNITFLGGCGPIVGNVPIDGGQILVIPGQSGGNRAVLGWVDGNEDFRDRGDGWPVDPELRAAGPTPLAGAVRTAENGWYSPILAVSKPGAAGYDPQSPDYDPQIDCRPYSLVVLTDGADTCEYGSTAQAQNPPALVQQLYGLDPQNPVRTYVVGLAFVPGDSAIDVLNQMAANGGTGSARFANNEADIEAAFADIAAASVKVEVCNNRDDNCNGIVDEGFDKGAACTVGTGACQRTGILKCDSTNDTQTTCCVDDGNPSGPCTPLSPGPPQTEVCNGIDDNCDGVIDEGGVCNKCTPSPEVCDGRDNDCDGIVDNHLVDAGKPCGIALGQCRQGVTACVPGAGDTFPAASDHLVCQGAVGPSPEVCNGLDDDCDGVVDGMRRSCYSGPAGTEGVGRCVGGLQDCTAKAGSGVAAWGACVGEVLPQAEVCDGLDDDCDGKVDDVAGAGASCCPSGLCGKGGCKAGTMQCSGGHLACIGAVGPKPEVCNGLDDDCDGKVDDVPGLGAACRPPQGCSGTLVCDTQAQALVCRAASTGTVEICNGLDDDCDGLVDEEPDVDQNDPRVGQPCGNDQSLPSPCKAGVTACKGGQIVCVGAVGPAPEACDCKDNDCNGLVDDNAACPPGTECYKCGCYARCGAGEFGCPGGYDCDDHGFCVPPAACNPPCPDTSECRGGTCVDLCADVHCPDTYVCRKGLCVGDSCVELHDCKACQGGSGERCDPVQRKCVPDLCCGSDCSATQFCDPGSGACIDTCAGVQCPEGNVCLHGTCQPDRCAGVDCPEGQACDPADGKCRIDSCFGSSCGAGAVCVRGACQPDPCPQVRCPAGLRCAVSPFDGSLSCDAPILAPAQQDRVVATGGGGLALGCSVEGGGRGRRGAGGLIGLLIVSLAGLLLRRRGRSAR